MAKSTKQDRKLIAAKQKHEINFIHAMYKVPKGILKEVLASVGRSRSKVYDRLRELGYAMPKKRVK